ncbi:hypothetical protein EGW08_020356 [Elysia chlorotica]|uniref:Uncharacterized protein n=1 Tax=Elysia chlorotica TaxID=188477 RepID=A0A3S1B4P2_ELYCH|nr:hypothetical protein EGW08_020356 [Elysia chlorotica]
MGLSPVKQGGQTFADVQGFWLTVPQTVVARAFLAEIPQNQPGNATQCELSQHKMAACNDLTRAEAMTACFWMLREARFIRCIDQGHTANRLLFLFNKCVEAFCEGEPQDNFCQNVVNIIRESGCADVPGIPVLASFVKGDFCPP